MQQTDTFVLSIKDGTGGTAQTATSSLVVTITGVNDAPVAALTTTTFNGTEDTPLAITGISMSDADSASGSITLAVNNGTLTVLTNVAGGVTSVTGNGSGSVTLTGTIAQINATLAATNGVVFNAAANANGANYATLTATANDGSLNGTARTAQINITAVNDAPVAALTTTTFNGTEDTPLAITGISMSDADSASGSITLAVSDGTLTVLTNVAGGVTSVAGNGSGSVTLTGTIAQINATLAATNGVVFNAAANANGANYATLTATANDGSLNGTARTAQINITAVNDAPVAALTTTTFNGTEDTPLAITGISMSDADSASGSITLAVNNGTLTVLTNVAGGVTSVTGNGSGSVTLTGTIAQINATLAATNGVVFNAAANANGANYATLTATANDGSLNGTARTAQINITAVNDAPVAALTTTTFNGTEDTPLAITGISMSDADSASGSITLAVSNGTLTVLTNVAGGVTSVTGNGSGSVTLTGTIAQINATLAATNGVVFNAAANANGANYATLTATANDGSLNGTARTAQINITAVNDAPVNSLPALFSGNEDTVIALTGISVSDIDAGSSTTIIVTLQVDSGALLVTVPNGNNGTTVSGNNTAAVTLTGSISSINAVLAANSGLVFHPSANFNGAVTLTMTSSDGGATGTGGVKADGGDQATITVWPVNDAPVAALTTTTFNGTEDTPLAITGISMSDADSASGSITLAVSNGTLTVLTNVAGGVTSVAGNGSGSVTLTGTIAQINATLAATNGVVFNAAANANGANYATLTATANDGSLNGTARTAQINITAVNDAPVNSLPALFSGNEDTVIALTGISVSDIDAGSSTTIIVTLQVDSGALLVTVPNGNNGTTVSGNNTAAVTLTGSISSINAVLAANSGLVFHPSANFNGAVTLTMTSSDGGATGTGGVKADGGDQATITVWPVNDAPAAVADTATAIETTKISIDVLANAYDVDNTQLEIVAVSVDTVDASGTPAGSASIDGDRIVFQAAAGYVGTVRLSYTVSDGELTAKSTVDVTVIGLEPAVAFQDQPVALNVTKNFLYLDGNGRDSLVIDKASIIVMQGDVAVVVRADAGDDFLVVTPQNGYNGTAIVQYTLTNGTTQVTERAIITVGATIDLRPEVSSGYSILTAVVSGASGNITTTSGAPVIQNDVGAAGEWLVHGTYGDFSGTIDSDGVINWTYVANQSNPYLLALKNNQIVVDGFEFTDGGRTQKFFVTLQGQGPVATPTNDQIVFKWDESANPTGIYPTSDPRPFGWDGDLSDQTITITPGSEVVGTLAGLGEGQVAYVDWSIRVSPNLASGLDLNGYMLDGFGNIVLRDGGGTPYYVRASGGDVVNVDANGGVYTGDAINPTYLKTNSGSAVLFKYNGGAGEFYVLDGADEVPLTDGNQGDFGLAIKNYYSADQWIYSGRALISGSESTTVTTPVGDLTINPDGTWSLKAATLSEEGAPLIVSFGERQPLNSGNVAEYNVSAVFPNVMTLDQTTHSLPGEIILITDYQSAKLGWDTPIDPNYVNQGPRIQDEVSAFIKINDGTSDCYFALVLNDVTDAIYDVDGGLNASGWVVAANGLWQNRISVNDAYDVTSYLGSLNNLNGNALDNAVNSIDRSSVITGTSLGSALTTDSVLAANFAAGNFTIILNDQTMTDPRLKDQLNYDQQNPLFGTYQARLVSVGFDRLFSCDADNLDIAFTVTNVNYNRAFGTAAQAGAGAIDAAIIDCSDPAGYDSSHLQQTILVKYSCATVADAPEHLAALNGPYVENNTLLDGSGNPILDDNGDPVADPTMKLDVLANDPSVQNMRLTPSDDPAIANLGSTYFGANLSIDSEQNVVSDQAPSLSLDYANDWGARSIYDNLRAGQVITDTFSYQVLNVTTWENGSASFNVTGVNDAAEISVNSTAGLITSLESRTKLDAVPDGVAPTASIIVGNSDLTTDGSVDKASGELWVWDADAYVDGGAVFSRANVNGNVLPIYREAYLLNSFVELNPNGSLVGSTDPTPVNRQFVLANELMPSAEIGTENEIALLSVGSSSPYDFEITGQYGTWQFEYHGIEEGGTSFGYNGMKAGANFPAYETGYYTWTFTLDRTNPDVNFLSAGNYIYEKLDVSSLDGTRQFHMEIAIRGNYVVPAAAPPPPSSSPSPSATSEPAASTSPADSKTSNPVLESSSSTTSSTTAVASTTSPVLAVSGGSDALASTPTPVLSATTSSSSTATSSTSSQTEPTDNGPTPEPETDGSNTFLYPRHNLESDISLQYASNGRKIPHFASSEFFTEEGKLLLESALITDATLTMPNKMDSEIVYSKLKEGLPRFKDALQSALA